MKSALLCMLALALLCSTGCFAADHDFDSVVSGVEQRYSVHAERIPLMGLISLCAHVKTHGGVKGMRIAEFHRIGKLDAGGLDSLIQAELGAQWQPMVKERSTAGSSLSVVFVRPSGHSMHMMVASLDHGELDLVRMEINGSALAQWMHDPHDNASPVQTSVPSERKTD